MAATVASWIDMGTFAGFQKRVNTLNKKTENREYRFSRSNGNFWLFEAESKDEILGAILHVQKGRVYAISEDVYAFVQNTLR
jgi:hypothetical protein